MARINYRKKWDWEYELNEKVIYQYKPSRARKAKKFKWNAQHAYFEITSSEITVNEGYSWDGLTGWTDAEVTMRASLIHDVLYQAIEEGLLDRSRDRKLADLIFRDILMEDGTRRRWAKMLYKFVRWLG
ncbi:MAG: DUF1353 domain-containing protein [Bryobacterales bacterium]|nr:DUF1353 domain-containing protein [Bryobacterales bacterium]